MPLLWRTSQSLLRTTYSSIRSRRSVYTINTMAASASEVTAVGTSTMRCSRSPSPSAKRIKLSNGNSNMSTSNHSVGGTPQTIPTHTNKQEPAVQTTSLSSSNPATTTTETSYPAPTPSMQALVEEEMAKPIEVVKTYEKELEYENKLVLAPMVRTGSCESLSSSILELSVRHSTSY